VEVWLVEFDPAVGDEIRKVRPAAVISVPYVGILNVRMVVPITDGKERYRNFSWITFLEPSRANGLSKESAADAFQCKSLSLERFQKRIGVLTSSELKSIVNTVGLCIGL
jgi:mRNA interferase MazF